MSNIEQSFNIRCNERNHESDMESVKIWIEELNADKNKPVAFFKPLGQEDIEKSLGKGDFVVVIMTDAQSELLKKFRNDCICIDGPHGTNQYGYQLFILMVLDDLRQGFPCTFLISNRSGESVLAIYFAIIKLRTGILTPNIFMSDMANEFYNAWITEMGMPCKSLFCTLACRPIMAKKSLKNQRRR